MKKDAKKQYQKDRYNNMTAEEKQKYKKYQKIYHQAKKQQRKTIGIFLKTIVYNLIHTIRLLLTT